jgi:flagellar basal body rod protein FlgC
MASDMIQIAASGAKAARAALDITAQNIANASTEGYIRRSVNLAEQSSVSARSSYGTVSQYGVRVTGINRNADPFLQSEVRRTNSDAARADTLVSGLTNISDAVENSDVFESITSYQSALSKLTSSPTDSSLRANVLENARTMRRSTIWRPACPSLTCASPATPIRKTTAPPCSMNAIRSCNSFPAMATSPPPLPRMAPLTSNWAAARDAIW